MVEGYIEGYGGWWRGIKRGTVDGGGVYRGVRWMVEGYIEGYGGWWRGI